MLRWGNQKYPWPVVGQPWPPPPSSAAPIGAADLEDPCVIELTDDVIEEYYQASIKGQMQPRDSLMPDYASAHHAAIDKKATLCLLMEAFM